MKGFVPREKMSKKARREMDSRRRQSWAMDPRPRIVESKKIYNRKKAAGRDGSDRQLTYIGG